MRLDFTLNTLFILILISIPMSVIGQAVTIIGSGYDARSCFMAANNAARVELGFVSKEDLETCTRAIEHGRLRRGDLAGTYVNRGIVETALGRYQDAFDDYRHAMELRPELPEPFVGRGNIYFLAGKFDNAIEDYTRALELNISRDYIAHFNRGMALEKTGQLDDAEANYRRALELQPEWQLAQDKLERLLAKQQE